MKFFLRAPVLKTLIVMLISAFLWSCSSVKPANTPPPPTNSTPPTTTNSMDQTGYVETGKASFYAYEHHLKKTANGEVYDPKLHTAAHRTLPFGTRIKVTNTENGKSIVVKINDRGPFVKDRILDLSQSAFRSIANTSSGIIEVKIEIAE